MWWYSFRACGRRSAGSSLSLFELAAASWEVAEAMTSRPLARDVYVSDLELLETEPLCCLMSDVKMLGRSVRTTKRLICRRNERACGVI
jgi:hypothetical protein